MKSMLWGTAIAAVLLLAACGGGGTTQTTKGGSSQAVVDPSGNWTMTATDAQGQHVAFAALFNQVGSTVTANSFTASNDPAPFSCVPLTASIANGTVQNVDQFSGAVTLSNRDTGAPFGTFSFTGMLNPAGTAFSGTFSGMPSCTGIGASGTFTGAEVPSTSGTWSGTIQPCSYDQQTGVCTLAGTSSSFAAVLSQNDATGNVTGTYQVTSLAGISSGTVAVAPPFDILSGLLWQFTLSDGNGDKFVAFGALSLDRKFSGHLCDSGNKCYSLSASH
jgi:hypothetical protein